MQKYELKNFTKGWFVGNFSPSLCKSEHFEVAVMHFNKGDFVAPHTHKIATEYNVLIEGKMRIKDTIIEKNQIFVLEPNEIADPEYLEDCTLVVVKSPSVPTDKYEV
jgi:quercetin dioxygenase-like cupin family protein